MAGGQPRAKRAVMLSVFATAFLDLVGFSIIFPLFPQLLAYYVEVEGPSSLIGRISATLTELAGNQASSGFLVVVLFGGVLGSLYSVLQFVFAPIWGGLSDRIGRRPTLLLTLSGTVLSYVMWFFSGSFAMLIAARLLGGLMAGNLSTVSAVVADVTDPADRSRGMGIVGAAIGIGFIFGPAIGGITSMWDFTRTWPEGIAFGVNPFSGPALIALVLSTANLVLALATFEETLPPERRGTVTQLRSNNPLKLFRSVSAPGVQRVNLLSFLYLTAFSGMEFSLTFLAVERFAFTPRDNAKMFVFVGVVIALVQGGALRRLAPRFGDKRVATAGLFLLIPGFVLVGASSAVWTLFLGLGFMAVGSAFATPCLGGLVSRYAPEDQQGLALGMFRSMGSLSRAVGPLVGGILYFKFGAASPYEAGAVFLLLPIVLAFGLPRPSEGT